MNQSAIVLVLAALAAPPSLAAQEAPGITLEEALRLFAVNNLDLRMARARAVEAAGLARQAAAFPNPTVAVTHEPLSVARRSYQESYLNVSQRVEVPGKRGARADAADHARTAAIAQLQADSTRLAFEVKRAFVEAALAAERAGVTERVTEVFRVASTSASTRHREGDVSLYDLRRIGLERARYENLEADAALSTGVAERALSSESQEAGSRLSVVLAAAGAVRELNRQHRGLDESTDVLSFSFTHHGEYYGEAPRDAEPAGGLEFVLPPGQSEPLGEVVISYPTA